MDDDDILERITSSAISALRTQLERLEQTLDERDSRRAVQQTNTTPRWNQHSYTDQIYLPPIQVKSRLEILLEQAIATNNEVFPNLTMQVEQCLKNFTNPNQETLPTISKPNPQPEFEEQNNATVVQNIEDYTEWEEEKVVVETYFEEIYPEEPVQVTIVSEESKIDNDDEEKEQEEDPEEDHEVRNYVDSILPFDNSNPNVLFKKEALEEVIEVNFVVEFFPKEYLKLKRQRDIEWILKIKDTDRINEHSKEEETTSKRTRSQVRTHKDSSNHKQVQESKIIEAHEPDTMPFDPGGQVSRLTEDVKYSASWETTQHVFIFCI